MDAGMTAGHFQGKIQMHHQPHLTKLQKADLNDEKPKHLAGQ
jgi:hypothetical protein